MGNRNRVGAALALIVVLGFFLMVGLITFGTGLEKNKDFFNQALIAVIGFAGTALNYYLGSSKGSADKTALLNDPSAAPPLPPAEGGDRGATTVPESGTPIPAPDPPGVLAG